MASAFVGIPENKRCEAVLRSRFHHDYSAPARPLVISFIFPRLAAYGLFSSFHYLYYFDRHTAVVKDALAKIHRPKVSYVSMRFLL